MNHLGNIILTKGFQKSKEKRFSRKGNLGNN